MTNHIRHVEKIPTLQDIENEIKTACNILQIDVNDLQKETESRFYYVLRYVGKKLYKDTDILKVENNINNQYDVYKCIDIFDIYIDLCSMYNKIPTVYGYSYLSGVGVDILTQQQSNPVGIEILKRVNAERELFLRAKLQDGKQNPVGIITLLNYDYGYNKETRNDTDGNRKILSVNDLKDIFTISAGQKNIETK